MQSASAYELSLFTDEEGERKRLSSQAQTCFPFELPVYREFGLIPGTRVIDVGSGNGEPACLLQAEGLDVTCVDRDPKQVEHLPKTIRFVAGEANDLPFENGAFEAAFSRLVFQHLPAPAETLREMRRVVAPGGRIIVCDTDHTLRSVHPSVPVVDEAVSQWIEQARSRGADPSIGKRLYSLFKGAELDGVQVRVVPVTTAQIGARRFADILFAPFVAMMDDTQHARAREAIQEWVLADPFASAFFTIVSGTVPAE